MNMHLDRGVDTAIHTKLISCARILISCQNRALTPSPVRTMSSASKTKAVVEVRNARMVRSRHNRAIPRNPALHHRFASKAVVAQRNMELDSRQDKELDRRPD